jgi:hypothetical protein
MGRVIKLPQPSKMGKLPPKRVPNNERRSREYLSPQQFLCKNPIFTPNMALVCTGFAVRLCKPTHPRTKGKAAFQRAR